MVSLLVARMLTDKKLLILLSSVMFEYEQFVVAQVLARLAVYVAALIVTLAFFVI